MIVDILEFNLQCDIVIVTNPTVCTFQVNYLVMLPLLLLR